MTIKILVELETEPYTINLQYIHFPSDKVREFVTLNEDDSYTIFIERNLSSEAQRECFEHAMIHIVNEHFYLDGVTADEIEFNSHKK